MSQILDSRTMFFKSTFMVPGTGIEPVQPKPRDFRTTSSFDANYWKFLECLSL